MATHRGNNSSQAKATDIQTTATDIAVEFRELLGFVKIRNDDPKFDYAHVKIKFELVATNLGVRLNSLVNFALGGDSTICDKCEQLSRLLHDVTEDVRNELIAASPGATATPASAHSSGFAVRLPRNTTDAVGLIKSIIATAQGGSTPTSYPGSPTFSTTPTSALSPILSSTPSAPTLSPLSSSNPASSATWRSCASPPPVSPIVRHHSQSSARPPSLSRTNSSPYIKRDSNSSPNILSPLTSPGPELISNPPMSRSLSVGHQHHPLSPSLISPSLLSPVLPSSPAPAAVPPPLSPLISSPILSTRHLSSGHPRSPRKSIRAEPSLLTDGTTSHPQPPSPITSMILVIDKRRDPALAKLVRCVLDSISWITDVSLKSKMLAFFVGSAMGKVPSGNFDVCKNCANSYAQLKEKYANEPCPLGEITYGYARHRALLYKYLADSISLPARLHTRASELRSPSTGAAAQDAAHAQPRDDEERAAAAISYVEVYVDAEKRWCVVDLVKDVGELYEEESAQRKAYRQTGSEWEDAQLPEKTQSDGTPNSKTGNAGDQKGEDAYASPQNSVPSPTPAPPTPSFPDPNNAENAGPAKPDSATAKRTRSATGNMVPVRAQRLSTQAPTAQPVIVQPKPEGGVAKSLGKMAAKPAISSARAVDAGRVLRIPIENSEIMLNERIGKGTFGDVYRCRIGGYTCAVKIVNIKSMSEVALKMMHNEIHFLETLQHDNIVGFLGHEEIPRKEIKIFMEFMAVSLGAVIQKRNSSGSHFHKKDLVKCAKGMAGALSYLHHRKIIHRDIKSSNVLLEIDTSIDRIQEVRLCDFGVSKAMDSANSAITFTGTNLWVAPEVFDVQFGMAMNYDEKCDIWSFGMVLVEMVTLNPPYHGTSTQEATQHIRNGTPPSLEANANIPTSISNLIYSCLMKVPSERPSASDIINILNQL